VGCVTQQVELCLGHRSHLSIVHVWGQWEQQDAWISPEAAAAATDAAETQPSQCGLHGSTPTPHPPAVRCLRDQTPSTPPPVQLPLVRPPSLPCQLLSLYLPLPRLASYPCAPPLSSPLVRGPPPALPTALVHPGGAD
jgi:hypothetical protein